MIKKDILYPLRRLHGRLYQTQRRYHKKIALFVNLLFPCGRKVLIPGTPEHQNLGDSAIVIAQKKFLEKCGVSASRIKEVTFSEYKQYSKFLKRLIKTNMVIMQLGGGNMGDQWIEEEKLHRELLVNFPENTEIVFPQTVFYTSTDFGEEEKRKSVKYYNGRKNFTLFAREKKSYELMKSIYPDTSVLLVPDIVLSASRDTFGVQTQKKENILLCLRNDVEKSMTSEEQIYIASYLKRHKYLFKVTDMYSGCTVTKENRNDCVRRKMEEFAAARLVITDRLHGMVFAAITETPCIVFGNYNYKVEGTYEWIKYLPYIRFVRSTDEMEKVFPELLMQKKCKYDNKPLQPYFKKLEDIVKRSI